ncbi:MAG: transcriptional regulator [Gammaproteobacteria bacterium]|nr:transcriptional regulator [Gammaproteobacteria bacterium]MCP4089266.1 transcriptional regulator [Gammaproteobacteria bacterium]MCP4275310.1 transcriptional regulator [Gammaproteobacteria bacterium]MCP4830906.1 transcriptional regulator [Gammaproteobacteria bacterium]MCP4929519.1 transcriptional regulator [Gammaproteobacteria bacterium]
MNTANKLQDEWLLSYAAGALNPARSLMVASHLAYHDDLQESVADAEAIGGALLESMNGIDVPDRVLEQLLSSLGDAAIPEVKPVVSAGSQLPQPLMEFIDCDIDALNWRFMGPGMHNARLWNGPNDERLWLLKARGGVSVPEHGHNGEEWTLVIKGGYCHEVGQFGVGEIDLADEKIEHKPLIDHDEECICLVMTEGPIRIKSLVGRIAQPFIGL